MSVHLTREQVRRVDRLAIERYGMSGLVLMENAGRNATALLRTKYGDGGQACIICGTGNNGGDGCVIARHLHNAGWTVYLVIAGDPQRMTDDTRVNHHIVEAMGLAITMAPDGASQIDFVQKIDRCAIVVDALLGTGFSGQVRSPTAELIEALNRAPKRAMVAIDVPSGLDCNTGVPSNATIHADWTITFVAPKTGFAAAEAGPFVGRVEVVDIGAPRELIEAVQA